MSYRRINTSVASLSDRGRIRGYNEDACFIDTERCLFIVSDGMGGAQAGDVASKIVVDVLPKMLEKEIGIAVKTNPNNIKAVLRKTITELSHILYTESKTKIGLKGMGATIVLAYIQNGKAYIAHVGDSRAYLLRSRLLKQLTRDHSIINILLRSGEITKKEAKVHPAKGQLSQYVGMEQKVYPDLRFINLESGDRLLLCTDGLTGMLSNKTIAQILIKNADPRSTCNELIQAANNAGGKDNITVVIIDCL